jgi:protein-S-isoprenylcysteine O-methyltransferase Ste14
VPDGQGPAVADDGTLRVTGPFAHVRQPLNLLILPLVWLNPRMSARLLGFAVASTVYIVLGVAHAESHMIDAYGEAYRQYQREVPLVPGLH